jgi:high-affinity Fe2+/Pb2+ permease
MFQQSEIVCLALAIPLSIPILYLGKVARAPMRLLIGAVVSALGAATFTVVEDIGWGDFFNLLEHVSYALTGVLLGVGCWRLALWSRREEEEP